jgi:peptidoglycan/xylan/chitin deacetylase (PgdA/CDA1 family)
MQQVCLLFHDVYVADPRESGFVSDAAHRYKLSLHDFDAQLDAVARVPADRTLQFLITVDDGGVSYYTHVADRLEARGWRGRCFVSTNAIGQGGFLTAAQIRELDARGHRIGTHSASHPTRFSACQREQMFEEWSRSRAVLEDLLGRAVTEGSVPGGYYSPRVAYTARDAGLEVLFTSEPTTRQRNRHGIVVMGRFTIRRAHAADAAARLVEAPGWSRCLEWARWNAKGLAKPLLGPAYPRIADWILS